MERTTVITFLGTSLYSKPTLYCYCDETGEEIQAKGFVFAQALCQFFKFDRMLVCMTEEAEKTVWESLQAEDKMSGLADERVQALPIATGNNTAEMWEIFTTIAQEIEVGETVIFDITHGLRSLPFLVFLFAAYLKSAKQVKIKGVYYGALELSNRGAIPAPVIDLSEFVEMFDWLTASERFIEMGDGGALARLLRSRVQGDETLRKAADGIEAVSSGLVLARPLETMKAAAVLGKLLTEASEEIGLRAKPFALLQEQVANAYGQFAAPASIDEGAVSFSQKIGLTLEQQLMMINWYREKGQIIQAVELAREWCVSVFVGYFKLKAKVKIDGKFIDSRKLIESALAAVGCSVSSKEKMIPSWSNEWGPMIREMKEGQSIAEFWDLLTSLRNDLAHSGMRENAMKAKDIKGKMDKIYEGLEQIIKPILEGNVQNEISKKRN
jgi:CRISPR-associated DxTHG motif protein